MDIKHLKDIAYKLYDYRCNEQVNLNITEEAILWATLFSKEELIKLWNDCVPQNKNELYKLDIPYDDELYNALAIVYDYWE